METLFLIGRIIFGGYFVWNAINHFKNTESLTSYAKFKNVPQPKMAVIGGGVLLLLGGAGVVLGIYPEIALVLLLVFLIPVTFMMHRYWQVPAENRATEKVNFEKNLALIGAVLMAFMLPW